MKKNDMILLGSLLIISLIAITLLTLTRKSGNEVSVVIDGQEVKRFDLSTNITYTIEGDNGERNTFVIENGYVNMTDANCPDKLCVHQKRINYNRETIVCLPNRVVLEIISEEDSPVDAIVN